MRYLSTFQTDMHHPMILIWHLICLASSSGLNNLFYKQLYPDGYCVRRFNATSQMGCDSKGIGLGCDGQTYLDGKVSVKDKLIILMPLHMFYDQSTQEKILVDPKIAGILLHNLNSTAISDDTCSPNCNSGLYSGESTCLKWNPPGMGTFFNKYPFPIMFLGEQKEIDDLKQCIQLHPTNCYVQLEKEMVAVGNSVICLRRNKIQHLLDFEFEGVVSREVCTPVRRQTLQANTGGRQSDIPIVLITRSDNVNLFPQMPSGYGSPGSGIVVLLSTARQLAAQNISISVLIFGSESLDYSSSSQYVSSNSFEWKDVIEIGQMAFSKEVFVHSDPQENWSDDVKKRNQMMLNTFLNHSGFRHSNQTQLPPCSIQNLLKTHAFSHLFLSDYDSQYENKYYHSFLDRRRNSIKSNFIEKSQTITKAILNWIGITDYRPMPDDQFVTDLHDCLFLSMNCTLFRRLATGFNFSIDFTDLNRPMNFYAFSSGPDFVLFSLVVRYACAKSDALQLSKPECFKANGAFIPALEQYPSQCIINYDFKRFDTSSCEFNGSLPLWTESIEGYKLIARYFLKDNFPEWLPILLGLSLTLVTSPFIWLIRNL